jgi:allantoinase
MALDLVIRSALVVGAAGPVPLCIGIRDGSIVALAPEISENAKETIDARGLHAFPGVIDAHVHFNEPGRADWEGIATGSAALAAGGGTCFIDMPLNSSPPTLDAPSFALKLAACRGAARTDFALWGGLTPDNLDQLEALAECGVVGFKAFMSSSGIGDFRSCDDESLYRGMRIAARLGLPVAVHAENEGMTHARAEMARAAGRTSVRDYLDSRPVLAEAEAISRALLFAEETGCALHIVHTSSSRGVELVRQAADTGQCNVTCETCPHYLLLSEEDVERLGAAAKCAPPLRSDDERESLLAEVAAGRVDTIGSDHSPSPPEHGGASPDFFSVWGGISGIQTTLRALLTLGLSPSLIARLLSSNVADRFRLPCKGGIRVGADADLALVDLSPASVLEAGELLDRHHLSPYIGRTLKGAVRRTLVRGRTVALDGSMVGEPLGRFLRPTASTR